MVPRFIPILCLVVAVGLTVGIGNSQYILPYDTLNQGTAATDSVVKTDTIDVDNLEEEEGASAPGRSAPADTAYGTQAAQLRMANNWVRRLLFRGWLDTSHIGAFARYQLTSWSPAVGSFGPIDARITVYYLGSTAWQDNDAEWLQIAVQTVDDAPALIEYDVIVPAKQRINEIYRALYRVDRGEVQGVDLNLPPNVLDYDKTDEPSQEGLEDLEFYSGIFETEVYRGSGMNGADVYIYRADKMPPLGIVVLGYGEEGLTFSSSGSDASPRFYVPPPPGR